MSFQDLDKSPLLLGITSLQNNDEIMRQIEKENREESKDLLQQTEAINEIATEISILLERSGKTLLTVDNKVETSLDDVKITNTNLTKAKKYQKKKAVLITTGILAVVGISLLGPLGAYAGAQIGIQLIGGVVGSVTGGGIFGGTT